MDDLALHVEGLGKRYQIGQREPYKTLRESLVRGAGSLLRRVGGGARPAPEQIWALRGVSFSVARGEVVGVIGSNGAGKSTLLKILARITEMTEGCAAIRGRVGSLLEVGTGFSPELTGRENVYLNGSLLGLRKAEIDRKFAEIVDFAEVGQFIDTPVKRYSSGMYMRLAFAVAAHLDPEILIVDEVLSVGDIAFQQKCLGKMRGIAHDSGRTILFVSHNLQAVQNLCTRGVVLSRGRLSFDGPVQQAVQHYLDDVQRAAAQPLEANPHRMGDGAVRLTSISTCNARGEPCADFVAGEPFVLSFEFARNRRCRNIHIGFTVINQLGVSCTHINTHNTDYDLDALGGQGRVFCAIPRCPFPVGEYQISVIVHADDATADYIPHCLSFRVVASQFFRSVRAQEPDLASCPVLVDHRWSAFKPAAIAGSRDS